MRSVTDQKAYARQKTMMWGFAVIFLVPGVVLMAMTVRHLVRAMASESWPTVEATILRSEVEENHGDGTTYGPKVRFSYSIAGKAYESERLRFGLPLYADKKWAQKIVARYPVGSRVNAVVDPQQPSFCVLEPDSRTILYGVLIFSAAFVAVGVYAFSIAVGWVHFK